MNKFVLTVVVFVGFLMLFSWAKNNSIEIPSYVDESVINTDSDKKDKEVIKLVERLNAQNQKISSIQVLDMPMRVSSDGMTYKLMGNLSYKKDKYFRLKVHHRLTGMELDIGSNDSEFWFWSKRMQPPALYFSKHENLAKTNLKSVFNPLWMMESLNIGVTDVKKITKTLKKGNLYYTYENRTSAIGDPVTQITVYDAVSMVIVGRSLIDEDGKSVITTAYTDSKVNTLWHEENVRMEWDFSDKQVNCVTESGLFVMPDYKKKIDLSK